MSHNITILEGAFVLSDAHYSHLRPELLELLKDIYSKKIQPTQLILMGDIFDALFGGIPYTSKINDEAVKILNAISLDIEVIYLEGNHDFNLKNLFPHAKVFPISEQPVACVKNNQKIYLAHGDFANDAGYEIYTKIIRNPLTLFFLRMINFLLFNFIFKKLDEYLSKKDDCKEFYGFEDFIQKRLTNKYECDYFIEGHYHQNKSIIFDKFIYVNLAAFACNQRYFIVKSSQDKELLVDNSSYKEI